MTQMHGTVVALDGRGVIILGPSGAGKSTLALQLMAVGADLVADDRVDLCDRNGVLHASAPAAIAGRIEARGIGILSAQPLRWAALCLAVDLGAAESDRLPTQRRQKIMEVWLPLVLGPYRPHLYAGIRQLLLSGRCD